MNRLFGIRREDKNRWERRAPLTPDHVRELANQGLEAIVAPSERRVFGAEDYLAAGAKAVSSLEDCPVIFGVKEVPLDVFESEKTYVFFSHTIKGQDYNMAMLRRMMDLRVSLIDYECIADAHGTRLVFFSRFAGIAGMVESMWACGQRLRLEGIDTPLGELQRTLEYHDRVSIGEAIRDVAARWKASDGFEGLGPFVCGFMGSGNVSQGALEVYNHVEPVELSPRELVEDYDKLDASGRTFYLVRFSRPDLVRPKDPSKSYDEDEYRDHPDRYESAFDRFPERLTMLINGISWQPECPVFLTAPFLRELYAAKTPRLRVIGDITCDINGSIACTTRPTDLENPCYVWDPQTGETRDGLEGHGPVVMAVDNLPASLPVDASRSFGDALSPFVPAIVQADYSRPFDELDLPDEIKNALVLHRGELTDHFNYMETFLEERGLRA